jgi:hypothetical protein
LVGNPEHRHQHQHPHQQRELSPVHHDMEPRSMSNVIQFMRNPPPRVEVAEEFGREIYGARLDPSDPEACFVFLYAQHPDRWREVMANMDDALYAAGQHYIAAEMARAR